MAKEINKAVGNLAARAKSSVSSIDMGAAREKVARASRSISEKAAAIKETAGIVKEDVDSKVHELDRLLEKSITEYNDAYTLMNDKGIKLYVERCRSIDTIAAVEHIVNSIANHPKSFDAVFKEINTCRGQFIDACAFADKELYAARAAAGATLLSSVLLFASKQTKLNRQKNEEISKVKKNTEAVRELDAELAALLEETNTVRTNLNDLAMEGISLYQQDYLTLSDEQKLRAGALVNNTKTISALLGKTIG